jgi:hypothetical protein
MDARCLLPMPTSYPACRRFQEIKTRLAFRMIGVIGSICIDHHSCFIEKCGIIIGQGMNIGISDPFQELKGITIPRICSSFSRFSLATVATVIRLCSLALNGILLCHK